MTSTDSAAKPAPWHAAYPAPRNPIPATIRREDVFFMMKDGTSTAGKKYLLVDLRRNDHEGGTIRGSINLPAQSLYPTIPLLYTLFKEAGLKKVIWYCSSSKGRGNRAAGWFADYIADQGDTEMESLALLEGISGWANAGGEYVELMEEYDEKAWVKT
ncbi:Rhodanese-like domain-containing protein [Clohesyomyces aquaticus]|uniref:Rhodanese-like domain-containing protein n=1 Tax=Clohesyomyces aquaticus TaxID=1231657 RepID=A0A1Y1ZY36_9PLEO|nr:Rhodanese-like domain-containing protein [Clohesyomyces aquaticus]